MELASYLAGERWSDRPECTHAVLAALCREVNDHVSDEARNRLAILIPDVIGLRGDDPRIGALVCREAARVALPVGPVVRQGVSALSLLHSERVLNSAAGRPLSDLSPESARALAAVPVATEWARNFAGELGWPEPDRFDDVAAPRIIDAAVSSIALAPNADELLVGLLERAVAMCRELLCLPEARDAVPAGWADMCRLTTA